MTATTWMTHDTIFGEGECRALIEYGERLGFGEAPITTAAGFVMRPDIRNNTRVMFDNVELAEELWRRLSPWPRWPGISGRPVGLNERLRIYRYTEGQRFNWHSDGCFERSARERSRITLLLYLNDDFTGGSTDLQVWPAEGGVEVHRVTPERGGALSFVHHVRHQGAPVESGVKYVLRTDVMYAQGR